MITVEILLKEVSPNQLVISVEAKDSEVTQLEKTASMVMKQNIENALRIFQQESEKFVLDLQGDEALEWKRKMF